MGASGVCMNNCNNNGLLGEKEIGSNLLKHKFYFSIPRVHSNELTLEHGVPMHKFDGKFSLAYA